MNKITTLKKLIATTLAVIIAIGSAGAIMNSEDSVITTLATPTLAEYQQKISDLQSQQDDLKAQINSASSELSDLQARKELIDQEIALIEERIKLVNEYTVQLETAIADLDKQIRDNTDSLDLTQQQIDLGIDDYKQRLRALYIAGDSSYASVLLESEDFYDMLMRIELIKRVSEHDSEMINNLVNLEAEYQNTQEILQGNQDELTATMSTYTQTLQQLQEDKKNLEQLKAENEAATAEINQRLEQLGDDLNAVSKYQQQLKEEAATATTTTTTTTTTPAPLPQVPSSSSNGGGNNNSSGGNAGGNSSAGGGDYQQPDSIDVPAPSGDLQTVIDYAKGMVGGRYVWAGNGYAATDCSGLVMQSYAQIGIKLPHQSRQQASYGTSVSYNDMKPGDLIFWSNNGSYSGIYHVAMYIGNGMVVHAESTATGIVISYIYQKERIVAIKRLVN